MAEATGLPVRTLRRRMAEYGIRARGRRATSVDPYRRADVQLTAPWLRRLAVTQGLSAGEIARRTGLSARTVAAYMRRFDIPVRPVGGGIAKYHIDPGDLARMRAAGWTVDRIAERYGCSATTVERALVKAGLSTRLECYRTGG